MRKTLLLAAAGALVFTGLAAAQSAPQAPRGEHAREHGAAPHAPRRGARALMMLGAADANGDNQVTLAELGALRAAEFDYRDRNGDGFLTEADASPTRQAMADMREGGERRGRRGMGRVDTDGDGRISRSEFVEAPHPLFDRLDADANGVVTAAEIDAAMEARDERRQARAWWRD
ncbi:MAG: EF-hand domain-containing protein [Oceanicaulis sp.]